MLECLALALFCAGIKQIIQGSSKVMLESEEL